MLRVSQNASGATLLITFVPATPAVQATGTVNASVSNTACPLGTASSVTVTYSYSGLVLGALLNYMGTLPQPSATTVICDE